MEIKDVFNRRASRIADAFSEAFAVAVVLWLIVMLLSCTGSGRTSGTSAPDPLKTVVSIRTTQFFANDSISDSDMRTILDAGINAPSAMNKQPWHFSVVSDGSVLEEIQSSMRLPDGFKPPKIKKAGLTDAPAVIVVSCADNSQFDAGLACQNMSVAANLLGYGTKIISSPNIALNGDRKEEFKRMLDIPSEMSAAAVLLIGREASDVPDGVSAASSRKASQEIVSFI